ncbi:MAG: LLM class flavin-dependent oxidoreductase [Chloroflexi bacterium]|nr:LLM class flavin-dependent oxidoreductase [Chloroflexota bacterium]
MKVGVQLPQGWNAEFAGWDGARAVRRMLEVAALAERLGFESLWLGDHVSTRADRDDPFLEGLTAMTAVAATVPRVELGFTTLCSPFRSPALTAKIAGTLDAVSGGRLLLGLGAGWKAEEFAAYGFDFPPTRQRLQLFEEHLEVISRLLVPGAGPITWEGPTIRLDRAINNPASAASTRRIPILVGGAGPNVTFRLAARFADELNIGVTPEEAGRLRDLARDRCEEIGRNPDSLPLSTGYSASWEWRDHRHGRAPEPRLADNDYTADSPLLRLPPLIEGLAQWQDLGFGRVVASLHRDIAVSDDPLHELRADCLAAGLELGMDRPGAP